jgi:hypothetical protein
LLPNEDSVYLMFLADWSSDTKNKVRAVYGEATFEAVEIRLKDPNQKKIKNAMLGGDMSYNWQTYWADNHNVEQDKGAEGDDFQTKMNIFADNGVFVSVSNF